MLLSLRSCPFLSRCQYADAESAKMFVDFLKILILTLGCLWGVVLACFYIFDQPLFFTELLIGCLLPFLCFSAGFYAISRTSQGPFKPFIIAVFGGMIVRLFIIGIVFVCLAMLTQLHIPTILFALVGFYTTCLIVELYFVNRRIAHREIIPK